jgi:hypothetical protein
VHRCLLDDVCLFDDVSVSVLSYIGVCSYDLDLLFSCFFSRSAGASLIAKRFECIRCSCGDGGSRSPSARSVCVCFPTLSTPFFLCFFLHCLLIVSLRETLTHTITCVRGKNHDQSKMTNAWPVHTHTQYTHARTHTHTHTHTHTPCCAN